MTTETAVWHPTYCLNRASTNCGGEYPSHDAAIFALPDREVAVTANLFEGDATPVPLVLVDAHHDHALSPGQARALAQSILVAADEAESALTEWRARHEAEFALMSPSWDGGRQ